MQKHLIKKESGALVFVFVLLLSSLSFASSETPNLADNVLCDEYKGAKELSSFRDMQKAGKFTDDINKLGFSTKICRDIKNDGTFYKVVIFDAGNPSPEHLQTSGISSAGLLPDKTTEQADPDKPYISDDIFERKRRRIHPFVSVTAFYTDNIYNSKRMKKSDFLTVLSPGVWLSVPTAQRQPAFINSSVRSPGGFIAEQLRYEFFRRFMAYLFYQADIELYSRNASENTVRHRIQGRIEYMSRGGLSLGITDEYLISHDDRGKGVPDNTLQKYRSNLLNAFLKYDTGRKLMLKASYSNLMVSYDASRNRFMKRTDNAFSGYLFYKLRPKTALFVEYEFINIDYAENQLSDSREDNLWLGIEWDATGKTKGVLKAGYGLKRFDSSINKQKSFILESRLEYRLTSKTSFSLMAWRKTNETDIEGTDYIVSTGVRLGYQHKLTSKLTDFVHISYIYDHYHGDFTFVSKTSARKDNFMSATIGIRYDFRAWLNSEAGYIYSRRDSNFSDFDYTNNTFYFKVNSSL